MTNFFPKYFKTCVNESFPKKKKSIFWYVICFCHVNNFLEMLRSAIAEFRSYIFFLEFLYISRLFVIRFQSRERPSDASLWFPNIVGSCVLTLTRFRGELYFSLKMCVFTLFWYDLHFSLKRTTPTCFATNCIFSQKMCDYNRISTWVDISEETGNLVGDFWKHHTFLNKNASWTDFSIWAALFIRNVHL